MKRDARLYKAWKWRKYSLYNRIWQLDPIQISTRLRAPMKCPIKRNSSTTQTPHKAKYPPSHQHFPSARPMSTSVPWRWLRSNDDPLEMLPNSGKNPRNQGDERNVREDRDEDFSRSEEGSCWDDIGDGDMNDNTREGWSCFGQTNALVYGIVCPVTLQESKRTSRLRSTSKRNPFFFVLACRIGKGAKLTWWWSWDLHKQQRWQVHSSPRRWTREAIWEESRLGVWHPTYFSTIEARDSVGGVESVESGHRAY